ncbi:DUF5979 domain-containing protein [Ottowia thiooxydans]|uniref:DUF5979 domain-containing protein n=1 Tax=Ottowia thiooxydans TaxID=219182 RepID=UPI000428E98D|nr:DUF5979 domain-containing protein [Ottowia thiooxydans]
MRIRSKFRAAFLGFWRRARPGKLQAAFALGLPLLFSSGWVHAANVELTVSKGAPSTALTWTDFNYTITVGNTGNATTGTSTVLDTLPARLYDLQATSVVPIGGATCPTLAVINAAIPIALQSPATAESSAGQTISIPIPSLPQGARCEITISAKASTPGSYVNTISVTPAASDTDGPTGNTGVVTTSVEKANLDLRVTKELLTPSPANFGVPVRYRITFHGDPVISVPNLGTFYPRTFDGWQSVTGTFGGSNGGVAYASSIASCVTTGGATGCAGSPPAVTAVGGSTMSAGQLLSQTKISLPANSTLVIEEDVVFTPPACGGLRVVNLATLSLHANGGGTLLDDDNPANNNDRATLVLNNVGTCVVATNTLRTTKTLANTADTVVDTEGEAVGYVIRSTYTSPHVPVAGIRFGDIFQYFNENGSAALATGPAPSHSVWLMSCTVDSLGTGSACPPGPYPRQLQAPTTSYANQNSPLGLGSIAHGGFVEIRLEERWTGINTLPCLADRKRVSNKVDSVLVMPTGSGYANFSEPSSSPTSGEVTIDPNVPVCVDIATNKSVSPVNPAAGVPVTFNLQFTNNSLAVVGVANSATNVAVTDVLGPHFTATAASCSVTSGSAEAPSVSLANITGANNTFSAVIPRMDNGASVQCTVTGLIESTGSFSNTATANATSGSGRTGRYDTVAINNDSIVNYGIVPPATVSVTKTLSGAVEGHVAGSTFPVTVSCTVTPTAGGNAATVSQTVNLLPTVTQVIPIPPTTGQQTAACTVTEGATPATVSAGFAYGTPVITPATFDSPPGGSAAPPITVNNPLALVMGSLTVTPTVTGLVQGYGGQTFGVSVNCTGPGVTGFPQVFDLVADASQMVPVPLAAICTVTETQPPANAGFVFQAPIFTSAATVTITGEDAVSIVNNLVAASASPVPVPSLDAKALVSLMLMMAIAGLWVGRRRR